MLLIKNLNIPGSLLVTDTTSELLRYLTSVTFPDSQYWDTFKVNLLECSFISNKKKVICYVTALVGIKTSLELVFGFSLSYCSEGPSLFISLTLTVFGKI